MKKHFLYKFQPLIGALEVELNLRYYYSRHLSLFTLGVKDSTCLHKTLNRKSCRFKMDFWCHSIKLSGRFCKMLQKVKVKFDHLLVYE